MQLASEEVAHRQTAILGLQELTILQDLQAGQVGRDLQVDASRRGVGVGLDAVDMQYPTIGRLVAAHDRLVRRIGAVVQSVKVPHEVGQGAIARLVVVDPTRSPSAPVAGASSIASAGAVPTGPTVSVVTHAPILAHPGPLLFTEIGRNPRRDRSGSASRSVATRVEIGPVPRRDRSYSFRVERHWCRICIYVDSRH